MTESSEKTERDWTVDPETGRSNSSSEFNHMVFVVGEMIRDSAHSLLRGDTETVARSIMATLAHKYGLTPSGQGS